MNLASMDAADKQWIAFLQRWPLASLSNLTLQQYFKADSEDTFTYWLSVITEKLLNAHLNNAAEGQIPCVIGN